MHGFQDHMGEADPVQDTSLTAGDSGAGPSRFASAAAMSAFLTFWIARERPKPTSSTTGGGNRRLAGSGQQRQCDLAKVRRDPLDPRDEAIDVVARIAEMDPLCRSGLMGTADPGPPLGRGTDRPRNEAAAAVRAHVVQNGLDARRTECALVAADPGIRRIRRQVPVAVFAVRPKLQHRVLHRLAKAVQRGCTP